MKVTIMLPWHNNRSHRCKFTAQLLQTNCTMLQLQQRG